MYTYLFEVQSTEVLSQTAFCEYSVEALNAFLTGGKHFSIHHVMWQRVIQFLASLTVVQRAIASHLS